MSTGPFDASARRGDWLIGALCAAWLLALLWIAAPENDLLRVLGSQTMAAWVQAIGSIAAIVAAIWIDRGTSRRMGLAESEREERLQTGVLIATHEAATWIGAAKLAVTDHRFEALARRAAERKAFRVHLDHARDVLAAFSAEGLAETGLLPHVIRMRQNLSIALAAVGEGTFAELEAGRRELSECSANAAHVLRTMEADLRVPPRDLESEIMHLLDDVPAA